MKKVQKFLADFGSFWANFGCFLDPSHTILMPLRTQEHFWVKNDCKKIVWTVFEKLEIFIESSEEKNIGATACRAWPRPKTFNGLKKVLQDEYIPGPKT